MEDEQIMEIESDSRKSEQEAVSLESEENPEKPEEV